MYELFACYDLPAVKCSACANSAFISVHNSALVQLFPIDLQFLETYLPICLERWRLVAKYR